MNVIFDLGGVVLQWPPVKVIAESGDDPRFRANVRTEVFGHPDWTEMDRGTLDVQTITERIVARCDIPRDFLKRFFPRVIDSMVPMQATIDLLNDVCRAGVPAFVLSNMPRDFARAFEGRYEFWNRFTGVVFSCDVNLVKPDRAIFEYVLNRYALSPQETIFIDDTEVNIRAAAQLGFKTIHFKDARSARRRLIDLGCPLPI